ncbi:hypothetical protein BGZ61DRAFT_483690 [Ilyonectria robusta]|uniref:uncharacterized protein n=1 Tax=Ilyonectria robusta TaxID=1079257 RepID=UPI001E8CB14C|nr:uncharacterized protein BGZ61DRAFT_483690 [Ilyonectria robusta]KAH8667774.1 hypothetical protein BGZ61DRAFT_483690 [Ilyonectria robusta]
MHRQLDIRSRTVAPARNPAVICRFHLQGFCRAGDKCIFVHETTESTPAPQVAPLAEQAKLPCKFFLRGHCSRGEQCAFSHDQAPSGEAAATKTPSADTRAQVSCSFFAKGQCRNGDGCPFLHAEDTIPGTLSEETLVPVMEKCTRDLLGASISFGPGASVEKVSLVSDFSTARINNLPPGSSPGYVSHILSRIGIQVPSTSIRVRPQGQENLMMAADVRAEDPNFAKSLCAKFEAGELSQVDGLSSVKVFALAVPASNGAGGFAHRANCRKVICSWHKPMQLALLNFDDEETARDVCDRFSRGAYKVLGSTVSCGLRQADDPYSYGGYRRRFPSVSRKWTLSLRVPLKASAKDILRMMPRDSRPSRVKFEGTTYRLGEECNARQLAMIEKLLTSIGPLEMKLTANTETPGKRVKAMARFTDEADAKEAAGALNNTRLPFNESDKLNVNLVYSSTYKVATKVFEVVQGDIGAAEIAYSELHINFKHFPPTNGYTTLRLEGEGREELAAAEKVVDGILQGQRVTDKEGEKPFWNPSFGNRAAASKALGPIEQLFGVAFQCVPSKAEIRVYGTLGKVNKARDALLDAFGDSPSTSHFISLDEKSFQWAIRGGFRDLRDALGLENVILSILPTTKRIEVIGARASYDLAIDIMSGKKTVSQKQLEPAANDCSVCWTEAENALTTKCGHVYCLDCFENFCQSADTGHGGFNLKCLADEGSCGTVFGLPELQEHLSSLAFEELLASSAKSYVNTRPDEFRYCPTADCGRVYRVAPSDRPGVFTCPGCLKTVCTSCHHSHAGKSCAEYKYVVSGGEDEFEKAKKKLGIKDCPKCRTSIQKSSGCNHMTCGRCGVHICWVCLATFPTGNACYFHMNQKHGSIFPNDPLYNP